MSSWGLVPRQPAAAPGWHPAAPQQPPDSPPPLSPDEVNVGGIVAAVVVLLMVLALIAFGIWFAYSRGYFSSEFCSTHPSPGLASLCASSAFPAVPPPPKIPVPFLLFQREKSKSARIAAAPSPRPPCSQSARSRQRLGPCPGCQWVPGVGGRCCGQRAPPQCSLFPQHHQQEGHLQPALAPQRGECAVPRSVTGPCCVPGGVVSPGGGPQNIAWCPATGLMMKGEGGDPGAPLAVAALGP